MKIKILLTTFTLFLSMVLTGCGEDVGDQFAKAIEYKYPTIKFVKSNSKLQYEDEKYEYYQFDGIVKYRSDYDYRLTSKSGLMRFYPLDGICFYTFYEKVPIDDIEFYVNDTFKLEKRNKNLYFNQLRFQQVGFNDSSAFGINNAARVFNIQSEPFVNKDGEVYVTQPKDKETMFRYLSDCAKYSPQRLESTTTLLRVASALKKLGYGDDVIDEMYQQAKTNREAWGNDYEFTENKKQIGNWTVNYETHVIDGVTFYGEVVATVASKEKFGGKPIYLNVILPRLNDPTRRKVNVVFPFKLKNGNEQTKTTLFLGKKQLTEDEFQAIFEHNYLAYEKEFVVEAVAPENENTVTIKKLYSESLKKVFLYNDTPITYYFRLIQADGSVTNASFDVSGAKDVYNFLIDKREHINSYLDSFYYD